MVMGLSEDLSEGYKASKVYLSEKEPFDFNTVENLIVFGDSLSTVETNFTDMTYTGENNAFGDDWPLQLLNLKEMVLWDFAVSGSVIDENILPVEADRYTFYIQFDLFKHKLIKHKEIYKCNWNSNNSLFAFWFGTNDILYMDRVKFKNFSNEMIKSVTNLYFNTLNELYELGARNFIFFNLHSLNKLPLKPEDYSVDSKTLQENCETLNSIIESNALKFHNNYKDTNVFVYNIKEEIDFIQNNYKQFNFISSNKSFYEEYLKDNNTDINNYIMTDDLHFTYKTHEIIAKDINTLLLSGSSSLFINIGLILMNVFLVIYILF
ncbi:hypothetical protein BCR32DRAFT_296800 [Anaeromyces robustus]|uniref:Carbohydrate esterase family 16 protein n=1 Tax=Anaeromyces robustus TaxID=1754192 RepID=A0A1Y1WQ02_9FUNG|nr:hypothetical protein BCR32DRAFT_296800 [Anaeromyces robustus]|eukprot:ORX75619.1 hypothetical protein BCR32DRAFT_296800 [Anaeromyces robustus]